MTTSFNYINNTVIKAGSLVNGTGSPVRINVFLLIQNGCITSISGIRPNTDLPLVDLGDYTILPGFIDSHVHLFMCADMNGDERAGLFSADYETIKPVIRRNVGRHLAHGVVAVRDGGDAGAHAARYKNEFLNNGNPALQVKTAGRAFYKPGRYGKIVGGQAVNGTRLLAAISRNMETADHVKIINSGINSLTVFGEQTEPQFQPDELKAIVRLAGKKKQKVMVHANGDTPVKEAVEAGADSIEHGFFMGRDNLERMAEKGVFWVPTAGTMQAFSHMGREGGGVAARNLESQLEQIVFARKAGVLIALGTDAGSPGVGHGDSVIPELSLLLDAGYSVEQAIQCCTANGAALLGFNELGSLTPGMPANFIAARGTIENIPKSLKQMTVFRPGCFEPLLQCQTDCVRNSRLDGSENAEKHLSRLKKSS